MGADGGHLPARLGAVAARLRADLAMLHLVLGAFGRALFARLRAKLAGGFGEFGAPGQFPAGEGTKVGTGPGQLDAVDHASHFNFPQAFVGAFVAGDGAVLAGGNAVEKLIV